MKILALLPVLTATGAHGRLGSHAANAVHDRQLRFDDKTIMCHMIHQPVCGSNKKVYSNDCVAVAAGVTHDCDLDTSAQHGADCKCPTDEEASAESASGTDTDKGTAPAPPTDTKEKGKKKNKRQKKKNRKKRLFGE